jgi:hypothetical protein
LHGPVTTKPCPSQCAWPLPCVLLHLLLLLLLHLLHLLLLLLLQERDPVERVKKLLLAREYDASAIKAIEKAVKKEVDSAVEESKVRNEIDKLDKLRFRVQGLREQQQHLRAAAIAGSVVSHCCKLCWLNVGSGVGVLLNAAIKAIETAVKKEVDSAVEESKVSTA